MASIKKRGSSYLITVSLGRDSNGKKLIETITFVPTETTPKKIEKEVNAFALDFESRVKNGKYFEGEKITFSTFLPRWEENYAKDHVSTSTLEGYRILIDKYLLPSLGNMKMAKINALQLNNIFKEMKSDGKSHGTIKKVHAVASSIFTRAYKWGIVQENVCKRVELPKNESKKEMNCFTTEQAQIFLNKALTRSYSTLYKTHTRISENGIPYVVNKYTESRSVPLQFQVFFNLALYGGFRRGELLALTWNDIDFESNTVSITKSTASTKNGQIIKSPKTIAGYRDIVLPASCFKLLKKWRIDQIQLSFRLGSAWEGSVTPHFDNNFIFIQDTGKQMNLSTPTHKFKEIIKSYNKTVTNPDERLPLIRLHDLRHTSASILISQQVDIRTVANRLGHSKTSVTLDVYTHAFKQLDEKAANTLENLFEKQA